MKTSHSKKRIQVYSFFQSNKPKTFTASQVVQALGIPYAETYKLLNELVNLKLIQIERVEKAPHSGHTEPFYCLSPGQVDITPIVKNQHKKPGRKTTSTQAQSWEAVEADPKRFSQIEAVYSFLLANQQTSYTRRQLEERLKMRAGNLTSILKQLQDQNQVGIEKQDVCEYTGQTVYFYYAVEIKQGSYKTID